MAVHTHPLISTIRMPIVLAAFALLMSGCALFAFHIHDARKATGPITSATTATTTPSQDAFMGIHLAAESAIVYDLSTGQVLFSQDGERQLPLASLTKLLSVYAALDTLPPTASIVISSSSLAMDGDYGFHEGESFVLRDLARFTLVSSANDAAEAIVEAADTYVGESTETLLAQTIAKLGLSHTRATNGTGLDENLQVSGGYGSARDVAILAGALLKKDPELAHATTKTSASVYSSGGTLHTLPNTNQDVVHVPGALLSKTGFTDLAGGNLVVIFDAGIGHPIALVVLGSTRDARFTDVDRLLQATLAYFAGGTHT